MAEQRLDAARAARCRRKRRHAGLAGIGAASIISGLDGRTKIEVPERADIRAAWVATQAEPMAEQRAKRSDEPARRGLERGVRCSLRDGGARRRRRGRPGITADGKVILNAASVEELTRLPGVGQRRAQAIAELRTRLKRFRRVQDLLRVKGIGPRSLKRLLPHLVLDPPASAAVDGGR